MTQNRSLGIIIMISLAIMLGGLIEFSCHPPAELGPLTVIPHPRFGFEIVIIPPGTVIDGFTTTEPGLYLSGDALFHVLRELEIKPEQWGGGAE
jgi:hypothetical protein